MDRLDFDNDEKDSLETPNAKSKNELNFNRRKKNKNNLAADLYDIMESVGISIVIVILIFTFVVRIIFVDGRSMVPTLHDKDVIALNSVSTKYEYGDVVVLFHPNYSATLPLVKRVIATGGQTVHIDAATGSVFVDGIKLNESYINSTTMPGSTLVFPLKVPDDQLFVMGDNRNESGDSRLFGTVDQQNVIGKVFWRITPFDAFGKITGA